MPNNDFAIRKVEVGNCPFGMTEENSITLLPLRKRLERGIREVQLTANFLPD